MAETCKITIEGKSIELPIVTGTEGEKGIDIATLRQETGCITLDDGYRNTGSCQSAISFINGEKGILRYRGYPIEELAEHSIFAENAYLVIFGELPTQERLEHWSSLLTEHELLHESMRHLFDGFPPTAHPMAILSSMINASSCYYPGIADLDERKDFERAAARLVSQVRTIAAFSYKMSRGEPIVYPKPDLRYVQNFLHMMFTLPNKQYELKREVVNAMRLVLILHADHGQNCSTSTVRMVGSSSANLYASAASGACALWGERHGGANERVVEMLVQAVERKQSAKDLIELVTNRKMLLWGFGHAVYKNYDPRATILKKACDALLDALKIRDPLLDLAKDLEEAALKDDYFVERNLYPNVDFYSGIILRAIGIPSRMFTVLFAIGRMPGWIAHWREVEQQPKSRIYRPRQIYQGYTKRPYVPIDNR
jgi:citrate synthase